MRGQIFFVLLSTSVTSTEQEVQILVESFTSYDEKYQDIEEILKMYDDFNTTVKKRYLVLSKIYMDEVAKNRDISIVFQRESKFCYYGLVIDFNS